MEEIHKTTKKKIKLPFDLSTVKTKAEEPVRSGSKRLFGVKEAPTFYPTKEEFKDPLSYIKKISPEGEKYGIIKIVPPEDYNPGFSLETETFRFKTRVQKLNSMEGETRVTANYFNKLDKFHTLAGKAISKYPLLEQRPINLYKLKKEVVARGGIKKVRRLKRWTAIGKALGYTRKRYAFLANAIETAYETVVLPYEVWYAKKAKGGRRKYDANAVCELCRKDDDEDELLLCDSCNRAFHMFCLSSPLTDVPTTDWFCIHCSNSVEDDYGFEEGGEYSLAEFQTVCDNFKNHWFETIYSAEGKTITEDECEREFWRLVENPHGTCKVEYGADLHSTHYGSGFPAPNSLVDPWNLNAIPVAAQSLFSCIKSNISGMMIPWLYIGMCFSAFCWHNEDHYTHSINYMHWGETKTWYGVPGSDASNFEDAMKKAVPELFEHQPDLLFQLVTLLSPERLMKENVKVYAVDQRPGQFVVTFPKAYHSGFNHGYNFCEAVNFAPFEWLDFGLECVERYKSFKRQPCFSHDNLLVTAARSHLNSTENMDWLGRGLVKMQNRERMERQSVRDKDVAEKVVSVNQIREELQCAFCHCYAYLSYIGCECTSKVGCLEHVTELCSCDVSSKVMHLQFTDAQLDELVQGVTGTDPISNEWVEKIEPLESSELEPSINDPEDLSKKLHDDDGDPQVDIVILQDFIDQLDQWNSDTDSLLDLNRDNTKQHVTRFEQCQNLMEKALCIGHDLTQLPKLKAYVENLKDLESQITPELLSSSNTELQKNMFNRGLELHADSVNFRELRRIIEHSSWKNLVQQAFKDPFAANIYQKLVKDGEDMGLTPNDSSLFGHLVNKEAFGKRVIQLVENVICGKEKIDIDDETSIFDIGQNTENPDLSIELDPELISRLQDSLYRSKLTLEKLDNILNTECNIDNFFSVSEAQKLTTSVHELCFDSELATRFALEISRTSLWDEKLGSILVNEQQTASDVVLKRIKSNVRRITRSADKPNLYCFCRKKKYGLMIKCNICCEWYHRSCLKVLPQRTSLSYVCPVCRPTEMSRHIPHQSRQPTLAEITDLVNSGKALRFRPNDHNTITKIHKNMQKYKSQIQAFCYSEEFSTLENMDTMKYYLRTLMGLEVLLQDETDLFRSKIEALESLAFGSVVKKTTTPSTSSQWQTEEHERHKNEANFTDPSTDVLESVNDTMSLDAPQLTSARVKRNLVATVDPSLLPSRPNKIIKLLSTLQNLQRVAQ